jgi:hypothetical protein
MRRSTVLLVVPMLLLGAESAFAQLEVGGSLLDSCGQIDGLRKSGDFAGARAKADECLQGLDQQLQSNVGGSFPKEVAGWKQTGIDQGQALGFTNITATYAKGETRATVSLTGAGGGGGGLGGLLGGFAKLGAQAGQQIRVGGLPGAVQSDGTISVTLENGSFLTFNSSSFNDQQSALAGLGDLVNAFPVAQINKMVK